MCISSNSIHDVLPDRYVERAIRMAFSARAMRFITISKVMRKLAGALFQTIVPILTVLCFCTLFNLNEFGQFLVTGQMNDPLHCS